MTAAWEYDGLHTLCRQHPCNCATDAVAGRACYQGDLPVQFYGHAPSFSYRPRELLGMNIQVVGEFSDLGHVCVHRRSQVRVCAADGIYSQVTELLFQVRTVESPYDLA